MPLKPDDIRHLISEPSPEAVMEVSMWRIQYQLTTAELLWMAIALLDTVQAESDADRMDDVMVLLSARYLSGRGMRS